MNHNLPPQAPSRVARVTPARVTRPLQEKGKSKAMKRLIATSIAGLITALALVAFADETITMTGGTGGRAISVTTATNDVTITPAARLVSVNNTGSAVVYVTPRVTSTQHGTMLASTNAIAIPSSTTLEFVGGSPIDGVVLSAASGTNTVYISAQK